LSGVEGISREDFFRREAEQEDFDRGRYRVVDRSA
jgi:hypothetical protein